MEYKMKIGERIKQRRKEKKLTLKDLSEKINISVSFLSDIENGRSNPSLDRIKEIAEALDCQISYLLGEIVLEQAVEYHFNSVESEITNCLMRLIKIDGFADVISQLDNFSEWTEIEKKELLDYLKQIKNRKVSNFK